MRQLVLAFFLTLFPFVAFTQEKPELEPEELEGTSGLYVILPYSGRAQLISDLVRQKDRWKDLQNFEEVKFLPSWEKYHNKKTNRLLLVIDNDNIVYIAKRNPDAFEPVGYIKKKGLMKRLGGAMLKAAPQFAEPAFHAIFMKYGVH